MCCVLCVVRCVLCVVCCQLLVVSCVLCVMCCVLGTATKIYCMCVITYSSRIHGHPRNVVLKLVARVGEKQTRGHKYLLTASSRVSPRNKMEIMMEGVVRMKIELDQKDAEIQRLLENIRHYNGRVMLSICYDIDLLHPRRNGTRLIQRSM